MLGPRGIRVNGVAPGVIETDMFNFTKTESGRRLTLAMQALNRIGQRQYHVLIRPPTTNA